MIPTNWEKLAELPMEELVAMQGKIEADPKNQLPKGTSAYLYTPEARKKLARIAMAISHKLALAKGNTGIGGATFKNYKRKR